MADAWGGSWGVSWGASWGSGVTPPPSPTPPTQPSGGYEYALRGGRRRTPEEIRQAREQFGVIEPNAQAVIEAVAARQALELEQDEQKRFEELSRELELQSIQWDTKYLDALNQHRENLISQEIGRLLRQKISDEQMIVLLIVAAAA